MESIQLSLARFNWNNTTSSLQSTIVTITNVNIEENMQITELCSDKRPFSLHNMSFLEVLIVIGYSDGGIIHIIWPDRTTY